MSQRLVYLGTPEIAVAPLRALVDAGFDVALVVTNADKRRGRGGDLMPSPVKAAALDLGLTVSHELDDVLTVGADLGVVVAYGRIIGTHIIDAMPLVNIHFSLLPQWRGAAPVERALLAGDDVTGVCLMEIAEELDAGAVYARREVPIGDDDTLDSLRQKLVEVGSAMLVEELSAGLGDAVAQEGEITWARKLHADDFELDWTSAAAHIRRVVSLGRAFTTFRGKRLRIHEVSIDAERSDLSPGELDGPVVGTADAALQLMTVQPEGKARMAAADWGNGQRLTSDDRLGGQR